MGLREKLNNNPVLASVLAGVGIVLAIGVLAWQLWPEEQTLRVGNQYFYTEDDGATRFTDSNRKYPPFKGPTGKDAVRAHLFEFPDKSQAVMYLSRYTPEGVRKLQALDEKSRNAMDLYMSPDLTEVKKPQDPSARWVKRNTETAHQLMSGMRNGQQGVEVFP